MDNEAKILEDYRARPSYYGGEDTGPSGVAARKAYAEEEQAARGRGEKYVKPEGGPRYMPSAAKKAQAAQREAAAEMYRETRGKAGGPKSGNFAKGGSVSSASRRADGIASKGKTKGRMI